MLNGTLPLAEAAERQRQRLEAEQQSWRQPEPSARSWPPATERRQSWMWTAALSGWTPLPRRAAGLPAGLQDYRKMAAAEHKRQFTFTPDTAIATPQEFTAELLAWAANCGEGDRHHPREHGAAVYAGRHRVQGPCGIRVMCAISRSCGCGARCAIHRRWRWRATRSGCGCRDFCTTACRCLYALHWQWSGSAPGICRFGPTRRLCCWCWALSASGTASAGGISITTTETNKKNGEAARAVSHLIYPSSSLCSSSTVSARAAAPAAVSSPAVP